MITNQPTYVNYADRFNATVQGLLELVKVIHLIKKCDLLLWNLKVNHFERKNLPLSPVLSRLNPVRLHGLFFYKFRFVC
jgi:hypothetical protein